jgi:hypothetical protein
MNYLWRRKPIQSCLAVCILHPLKLDSFVELVSRVDSPWRNRRRRKLPQFIADVNNQTLSCHLTGIKIQYERRWQRKSELVCLISGYRRDVNEIIALLGCYAPCICSYRRLGTTYRSDLQGQIWPLKIGPIGCPGKSVTNRQSTLRKYPEQQRPQSRGYVVNTPSYSTGPQFWTWSRRSHFKALK